MNVFILNQPSIEIQKEQGYLVLPSIPVCIEPGLTATNSALTVKQLMRYPHEISMSSGSRPEKVINGKSIMGIMTLAAAKGENLNIRVAGTNHAALDLILRLHSGITTQSTRPNFDRYQGKIIRSDLFVGNHHDIRSPMACSVAREYSESMKIQNYSPLTYGIESKKYNLSKLANYFFRVFALDKRIARLLVEDFHIPIEKIIPLDIPEIEITNKRARDSLASELELILKPYFLHNKTP